MNRNTERMTVRNEDPEPYLCGNEREPHTRFMEYDGSLAMILTWRPVGSVEADSLGWRFITTEGRTVAVRPVQLPSNARPFCVPEKIESALRAASWLIGLAHGRVSVNGVDPDAPDKADRLKEIALYEINAFVGHTTGKKPVPVPEPRNGGGYTAGQRAAIVKKLTDPKDKGAGILEAIRSFILSDCITDGTYTTGAIIRDAHLRRLVRFMGEKIGRKDMTLRVLLKYNEDMPRMFKDWTAEAVKARKIKPEDAQRFLAARVTYIAECEGRRFRYCYPIEDMTLDVTSMEDRAPYQIPHRHEWTGAVRTGKQAIVASVDKAAEKKTAAEARPHPLASKTHADNARRKALKEQCPKLFEQMKMVYKDTAPKMKGQSLAAVSQSVAAKMREIKHERWSEKEQELLASPRLAIIIANQARIRHWHTTRA